MLKLLLIVSLLSLAGSDFSTYSSNLNINTGKCSCSKIFVQKPSLGSYFVSPRLKHKGYKRTRFVSSHFRKKRYKRTRFISPRFQKKRYWIKKKSKRRFGFRKKY